jgi:Arc/MetJ-type ribon-helix-helix transcriptional regulator
LGIFANRADVVRKVVDRLEQRGRQCPSQLPMR